MTDLEARAIVARAVAEGLLMKFPNAEPQKLTDAATQTVNAVINEYLRCRALTRETDKRRGN